MRRPRAVKGIDEYEAAYNFVHDNPANGIWCDHGCDNAGAAMPNGFWVHHNLVVNNGRWGVRMEFSPRVKSGVHSSQPTALIENNSIHANGYKGTNFGGASMWDAQNTTFRNNVFGPKTVAGVSYRANMNKRAILFVRLGTRRSHRPVERGRHGQLLGRGGNDRLRETGQRSLLLQQSLGRAYGDHRHILRALSAECASSVQH